MEEDEKDFDGWNQKQKLLHKNQDRPFFDEREIWWCFLGVNIGHEQDGSKRKKTRPVLVLKKLSSSTCLIVPLTTSPHKHPFRPKVGLVAGRQARAVLSQMRTIDIKRFEEKISVLDTEIFEYIRKAAKDML